jgi:hypothetical protein
MVDPVSNGHALGPVDKTSPETGHIKPSPQIPQWTSVTDSHRLAVNDLQHGDVKLTVPSKGLFLEGQKDPPKAGLNIPGADSALISTGSVSEKDEEAEVYNYTRMLQDPSGRLRKCLIDLLSGHPVPQVTKKSVSLTWVLQYTLVIRQHCHSCN